VDFKISNILCENCRQKIEDFYSFKKTCENSSNLLHRVKNEIEEKALKTEVYEIALQEEVLDPIEEIEEQPEETEESEEENENLIEDSEIAEKPKQKKGKAKTDKKPKKQYKKPGPGKLHQCQICGKLCKGIQMHMLTHSGEKKYSCYMCPKSFTQSGQLKRLVLD
jgi:hypothetical protein